MRKKSCPTHRWLCQASNDSPALSDRRIRYAGPLAGAPSTSVEADEIDEVDATVFAASFLDAGAAGLC
jgi:hypothetical protein